MVFNGAIVCASPHRPMLPAMACAVECAQAWQEMLGLEYVEADAPHPPQNPTLWVVVAVTYRELAEFARRIRRFTSKNSILIGYVFDGFFGARLAKLPRPMRTRLPFIRSLQRFDRIYTPIAELVRPQAEQFGLSTAFLPIGVDGLRFARWTPFERRFVTINGYGRQPPELNAILADRLNHGSRSFFHFTSHAEIGRLRDARRHRDHFWQLLRRSRIALAFSPESCDPMKRFPCSFVGQRWFESYAAGCVVSGRRPLASEAGQLLDWPDATIELSIDPEQAAAELIRLAEDTERLTTIGRANFEHCLRKHDWRWRAAQIQRDFPGALPDLSEPLAKLSAAVEERIEARPIGG